MKTVKKLIIGLGVLVGVVLIALAFPNQTSHLKHEVVINAPVSKVYRVLSEIDNVNQWVAPVQEAEYISDIKYGVGSARRCVFDDGSSVEEKVTEAVENQMIKMEMTRHDLPVEYFRWEISTLEETSKGKTKVVQTTEYKVKMGLIGVLMNAALVEPNMEKTLTAAYSNLKEHIENNKL